MRWTLLAEKGDSTGPSSVCGGPCAHATEAGWLPLLFATDPPSFSTTLVPITSHQHDGVALYENSFVLPQLAFLTCRTVQSASSLGSCRVASDHFPASAAAKAHAMRLVADGYQCTCPVYRPNDSLAPPASTWRPLRRARVRIHP